jgi:hypothetical protein
MCKDWKSEIRLQKTAMNTYYLTSKFKILYAIISILIFALLFKIFTPNYVCLGIYGALILVTSVKNVVSEKIVISDKGIEYHRLGLTFSTKWENAREIDTQWFPPFEQEGISLDPDLIRITEWWLGNYKAYGGWSRKAFIPLSKFSDNWRDSELGQKIKQHAPHLFEQERAIRVNSWQII